MAKGAARLKTASQEYSAGGVVVQDGKFLLVQVQNLEGRVLWTFPKGHLEKGETARQAALREVQEETGYRCEILSSLTTVRYQFKRNGRLVNKSVRWYLMSPQARVGVPDAEEILNHEWVPKAQAKQRLWYPGDLRLLEMLDEPKPENIR